MVYTAQTPDHGEYGVYQGSNTDTPLMSGSFDECTAWCHSNNWHYNEDRKTWDSGRGPSAAHHRIERIIGVYLPGLPASA